MRDKGFTIGFLAGLLVFSVANLLSYYRMINEPVLIDAAVRFGLPFKMYSHGGFAGDAILWRGLAANVLIAVCASAILGLTSEKLLKKRGTLR